VSAAAETAAAPNEWLRHLAGPIRRVLNLAFSVALTFLGLTCVTFLIGRIIPIDPVLAIVGDKASRATYNRVAAEIGVNLPIPVQYWRYLMKVLLWGVDSYDPLAIIGAPLMLVLCAAAAGFIPARRAASIEPMQALRTE